MTQHLVITAVGTDRPGIVNQLTQLVSACGCNIVDSRMALFGSEFTLIMLLSGSRSAMLQIETRLPGRAQQLELLTVLKPTTPHQVIAYPRSGVLSLTVADSPGVISQVTQFIADNGLDLVGLKSNLFELDGKDMLQAEFDVKASSAVASTQISQQFDQLCAQLGTRDHKLSFISL